MTAAALVSLRGVEKVRTGEPGFRLSVGSFDLGAGEVVACVGPSGSGKSTLIDLLALALKPDEGERFVLAHPSGQAIDVLAAWRARDRAALARWRGRHVGYVAQTGGLLPFLTVGGNIGLTQKLAGRRDAEWAAHLADRLGLSSHLRRWPERLSVGQRQRVAIARALASRPALVLADEPTASLDPANAEIVMDLFLHLVADSGAALVLVTHDAELARAFGLPLIEAEVHGEASPPTTLFGTVPATEPAE